MKSLVTDSDSGPESESMKIYRLRLRLRSKLPTPADSIPDSDSDSAALVETIKFPVFLKDRCVLDFKLIRMEKGVSAWASTSLLELVCKNTNKHPCASHQRSNVKSKTTYIETIRLRSVTSHSYSTLFLSLCVLF